jgi:hypothetical protein
MDATGSAGATYIFRFWSRIKRGERIHPDDRQVFKRMDAERHGFKLKYLPACFTGSLRTAPVVLLYLSPGYDKTEEAEAKRRTVQEKYWRRWRGREPLSDGDGRGAVWFRSHTRVFGDYRIVREKVAILNIGAYHSKNMQSYASMLALPSSRVTLDWAQHYLFPEALSRKRIVICMRSAAYWGLEAGKKYPGTLFAPRTTRNGYLRDRDAALIRLVRRRIGTG